MQTLRVGFISEGGEDQQSTIHRVIKIATGLRERGHDIHLILGSHLSLGRRQIAGPFVRSYFEALSAVRSLDALVIHRAASYATAALIAFAKQSGIRTVYDFDDALYLIHNPWYAAIQSVIRAVDVVVAGSHELLAYSSSINPASSLVTASVDTDLFNPDGRRESDRITIGWLGHGPVHRDNLALLRDPLTRLAEDFPIRLKIVSSLGDKSIQRTFRNIPGMACDFGENSWRPLMEMPRSIADFDLGVMPLVDSKWSRGKCGQKLVEYMSMGLPVVASDVGENKYIVENGVDGFLVSTPEEWLAALRRLVEDRNLRNELGNKGRSKVLERFSLRQHISSYERLVKSVVH